MTDIVYKAPPTCAAFQKSDSFGRLVAGPVGSGKTTSCIMELFRRSLDQSPGEDGLKYTRWVIVRKTLTQLKDTVLKDVRQWFGHLGEWRASENVFYMNFHDIRSEWVFRPLENADDQSRLLSMQLTGAFLSECIEMNVDVVGPISGRLGRYPSAAKGNPKWFGMIADTNFPSEGSPWWEFMEEPLPNWQIFKQPSGLAPNAENLNWLLQSDETIKLREDHPLRIARGRTYYQRFVDTYGEDSDWVKRYVKAQYGNDPSGMAVFANTFSKDFHVKPSTTMIPGYPLIIGQDFGRNPWSLICQVDPFGRLIVHREVPAYNVGLDKHLRESLKPLLFKEYLGYKYMLVGDPAGRAKDNISEETSFEAILRQGLPAIPAPTNDIDPRIRAVEALLGQQVQGGPMLVISAEGCPHLVRAMNGGYRFSLNQDGNAKPKPDKNDREGYSHVADCLQYVALVVHGNMIPLVMQRLRSASNPAPRVKMPPAAWT